MHPFFEPYMIHNATSTRRLCSEAVSEAYMYAGDEVFNTGDAAEKVYYVRGGKLRYDCDAQDVSRAIGGWESAAPALARCATKALESVTKSAPTVTDKQWITEIALWSEWIHCGPLTATECTELVAVSCEAFRNIVGKYTLHDHMLGKYASLFVERAIHHLSVLDIWFDLDVLEDLAWCAFQEGVDLSKGLPPSKLSHEVSIGTGLESDQSHHADEVLIKLPRGGM